MAASPQIIKKPARAPPIISTEAGQPPIGKPLIVQARGQLRLTWRLYAESPQSGEISPSDGTGGITVGDLSTQSIMGAFSICHIPTRSPARDDGGGFAASESAQTIEPGRRRRHPAFGNTASRQRTADSRQRTADSGQPIAVISPAAVPSVPDGKLPLSLYLPAWCGSSRR